MTILRRQLARDAVHAPAFRLVTGRVVGGVVSFAIPAVLARVLSPTAFGTYKQLFLIYATLFGLAQLGAAESLYYFVPSTPHAAGRSVGNALVTLGMVGIGCFVVLCVFRTQVAAWFSNPEIATDLPFVGLFLAVMLVAAAFEIVMVSRNEPGPAALTYAASDILRTVLFVGPGVALRSVQGVLIGGIAFALSRLLAMVIYLWREFGRDLRLDVPLWRSQLAYALPFAFAVGIDVIQANLHQWVVATRFTAAAFAIYAVGCLQIPFVDLISTSTANVMMVRMADVGAGGSAARLRLWHSTTLQLASLMCPLAALCFLTAHDVIVLLFTPTYEASVPIFRVWCLMILPSAFAVDGVLRACAQTRFLVVMNAVRLVIIVGLVGSLISAFGIVGAVFATFAGTVVVKGMAIVRIARVMDVGLADVLPWKRLAAAALHATVPIGPAWAAMTIVHGPLILTLATACTTYGLVYAAIWWGVSLPIATAAAGAGADLPVPRVEGA